MFDCIQLEAGSLITNAVPQFRQGEHSGTGLNMSGDGGIPPAEYHLAETTNLSQPGWIRIQTNTFDHSGLFAISNLTESESGFYRIEMD